MRFVPAVCENCNGPLTYDAMTHLWYCEHCNYTSAQEIPIKYYAANIGALHHNGIHLDTEMTGEMRMKLGAAEASIKLGKYEDALRKYRLLSDEIPQEYRVWWGQIRAITQDFSVKVERKSELDELRTLFDSTQLFAPQHEKARIEKLFMDYYEPLVASRLEELEIMENRVEALESEYREICSCIEELEKVKYFTFGKIQPEMLAIPGVLFLCGFLLKRGSFCVGVLLLTGICLLGFTIYEYYVSKLEQERVSVLKEFTGRGAQVSAELAEIRERQAMLES